MEYDKPRKKWFSQREDDWELLIVDIEPEKPEDSPQFVLGEAALAGNMPVQVNVWLGGLFKVPRPGKSGGWMSSLFRRGYFSSEED